MKDPSLSNLSPIDGRYREQTEEVRTLCSEQAMMKYRLLVETRYLEALGRELGGRMGLTGDDLEFLRRLNAGFTEEDAKEVKAYEEKLGHDVVAIVEYMKYRCRRAGRATLSGYVHFGITSEDVNNLSYSLMLRDIVMKAFLPSLIELAEELEKGARKHRSLPMLGHTHGEPASPTTVGKEFANYFVRLAKLCLKISQFQYPGKLTGTVGNFNSLHYCFPDVDWVAFSRSFVGSLGLRAELLTTQVLPHDGVSELLEMVRAADAIVQGLDVDMWLYCSLGYFRLRHDARQVGSSAMPHKVNPIEFENSEGNAALASQVLGLLSTRLMMSRMQRDLSDSTLKRNYGVALAHSLLAVKGALAGLRKLDVDQDRMNEDLERHYEVLGEALQHRLRMKGRGSAFEEVLKLLRGRSLTRDEFAEVVKGSSVAAEVDGSIFSLRPSEYCGLAAKLVDLALQEGGEALRLARGSLDNYRPTF
jgi:adenylosuccinate lyase